VHGLGCVPGAPFVGFSDVEEDGALVDAPGRLFGADGGDGRLALHITKL